MNWRPLCRWSILTAWRQIFTRLQSYLDQHKIANRPHIKTHKIPAIAKMQMDAGAIGITCQKVSEAEVMAAAGFDDIFLPYNIIGQSKLKRLMSLASRINLSVTADLPLPRGGYRMPPCWPTLPYLSWWNVTWVEVAAACSLHRRQPTWRG